MWIYEYLVGDLTDPAHPGPPTGESMIFDILPPYINYENNSWRTTTSNTVRIKRCWIVPGNNGTVEIQWEVPCWHYRDIFEVQYKIKSSLSGWQSIGVTSYNATTIYGSDYCKVMYQNWQYYKTGNASDIWTNETPDVSIFVKESAVPDLPTIIVPIVTVMAIFYIIRRKR